MKNIIEQYPDCSTNGAKLKGIILDLYSDTPKAIINTLVMMVNFGMVKEIQSGKDISDFEKSRWQKQLQDEGLAEKVIETSWNILFSEDLFCKNNNAKQESTPLSEFEIKDGVLIKYSGNASHVVIPDCVTKIGKLAFENKKLTGITIPDSVISIGDLAFCGCNKLENIYITDIAAWCKISGLNNITECDLYYPDRKLYLNNKLITKDLVIPNGVTFIGNNAFYLCDNLTSVSIPNSVTSIGEFAFYGCKDLRSVTIPDSVTSIGECAFCYCRDLRSVTIGSNVTFIAEEAFDSCYKLVEVINNSSLNITKGSKDNGGIAFYALNVKKGGSSDIVNQNGYLFYTVNSTNYLLGFIGNDIDLKLPVNYHGNNYEIYNEAFRNCIFLTSVMIPDRVTSIGVHAFSNCSGLASIKIPKSVTSIGECAFEGCLSLTSVTIPNSVTSIGESAFEGCLSLTSVTIPDSVTSIGSSAFMFCEELASVIIGKGVTNIGYGAFDGCTKLVNVVNNSSLTIK